MRKLGGQSTQDLEAPEVACIMARGLNEGFQKLCFEDLRDGLG